jgi:predicted amidohydrolase YtcJ
MRHPSRFVVSVFCAALGACASSPPAPQTQAPVQPPVRAAELVILSANVVTFDEAKPAAQAVAVSQGRIEAIGSNDEVKSLVGDKTVVINAEPGTTVMPGFIDAHSHTAGYSFYNDPVHWIDVSSVNMFFKPPPGDSRCKTPDDPQQCFIPVKNQADVEARIKKRLADIEAGRSDLKMVLAFNYDPARMGRGDDCKPKNGVGFQCRTFENGRAREQLDRLSKTIPIYVASESGHIGYVNTPALQLLNICGVEGAVEPCYTPTTNPEEETKLARIGQLDEDLCLYGTGYFQSKHVLKGNKGLGQKLMHDGAMIYANHGYTLVQEGAANAGLVALYEEILRPGQTTFPPFPTAVALIAYDAASADFTKTLETGLAARAVIGDNPLLSVAALKSFADGSPQGFTANLSAPYLNLYRPFTEKRIFKQPYTGLPDVDGRGLHARLETAHEHGFPMVIHQNGDRSITEAVDAILAASPPPAGKRDVVLHAPMITSEQIAKLAKRGNVVASYLIQNVYFWGLPECHQVLGNPRVVNMYPVRASIRAGLRSTFHSDSPVTTPYPLFEAWVAKTRRAQEMPWYISAKAAGCPSVLIDNALPPGDQSVSIRESLRALTVDAAWQYGMEKERGTLAVGKYADMVMLSADPLAMEDTPDALKTVRVLRTIRYGHVVENPNAKDEPIWPAH